jgi:hypothetical protein
MAKTSKRNHEFTITVSAPSFLSRREVAREIRTLINNQSQYLGGKPVYDRRTGTIEWREVSEGDIKTKKLS